MSETNTTPERTVTTTGAAWQRLEVARQALVVAMHLLSEAGQPDLVEALDEIHTATQQRRDRA